MIAFFIVSCGDDTDDAITYQDGVFIVNEGPFLSGTGTLSFIGDGVDTIASDIYSRANMGAPMGNIAQSMILHNSKIYIAVNNADMVVVAAEKSLLRSDTIGVAKPRYFASTGNKLYVSAWGASGFDGGVYEILSDGSLSVAIISGSGPEGMLMSDEMLYIAKGGGFGTDSTLVIVDTDDNSVVSSITVAPNPESLVESDNGDIYLLCRGFSDFYEPMNDRPGAIVQMRGDVIVNSYPIAAGSSRLAINQDDNKLYFLSLGTVKSFDLDDASFSDVSTTAANPYSIAYDNSEKLLYVGDAKDFSSRGEVIVSDGAGANAQKFDSGVIPTYFYFD